jgi:hypothetical protein
MEQGTTETATSAAGSQMTDDDGLFISEHCLSAERYKNFLEDHLPELMEDMPHEFKQGSETPNLGSHNQHFLAFGGDVLQSWPKLHTTNALFSSI